MEDASRIAPTKTSLFKCTAALGLLVSLLALILWPSSAIAQQSWQVAAPDNFFPLTGSTPNIPSALRWRTLPAEGTFPQKQAAELRMNRAGTVFAVRLVEWPTPRIGPDMLLAPAHNSRVSQGWSEFAAEDTAFSTQMRMPIAAFGGGRLQVDGFYLEVSANSIVHGLPPSSGLWWAAPANLNLRSATSYGVKLSFRLRLTRARTLYRYLFGGGM